jgi:hypothetical protein
MNEDRLGVLGVLAFLALFRRSSDCDPDQRQVAKGAKNAKRRARKAEAVRSRRPFPVALWPLALWRFS